MKTTLKMVCAAAFLAATMAGCPGGNALVGGWFTDSGGITGYTYFYSDGTLSWGQSELDLSGTGSWELDGTDLTLYVGSYSYTGTFDGGDQFSVSGLFDIYINGVYQGYADWGTMYFYRDKLMPEPGKSAGEDTGANPGMGVGQ